MSKKVFDAIVIGAGVNGSAAALHLAKYGNRTALLEQFPIPHTRGSSAGQSRLTRYSNTSDRRFLPIIIDSFIQWKRLEKETCTSLLRPCSVFQMCKNADQRDMELMYLSLKRLGRKPSWMSGMDFNTKFKTSFPVDCAVLEDSKAGVLMANKCLSAIQKRFENFGGTILDEFPVTKISADERGGISVEGPKGIVEGDHLVICAGSWSPEILHHIGINHVELQPLKVEVNYWRMRERQIPPFVFRHFFHHSPHVYGLPSIEYPGMFKISLHDGVKCDPDARDIKEDKKWEAMEAFLCDFVQSNFPWLEAKPVLKEMCLYTMSPDEEMIIDRHPIYKNIVYACGFSGSGFKTALTVGQILSELALEKSCSFDITAFRSDRFIEAEMENKL